MTIYEQSKIFCIFFIIGLFVGFIFDIFRSFRKNFKVPDIVVAFQDLLFLILVRIINFTWYNFV